MLKAALIERNFTLLRRFSAYCYTVKCVTITYFHFWKGLFKFTGIMPIDSCTPTLAQRASRQSDYTWTRPRWCDVTGIYHNLSWTNVKQYLTTNNSSSQSVCLVFYEAMKLKIYAIAHLLLLNIFQWWFFKGKQRKPSEFKRGKTKKKV